MGKPGSRRVPGSTGAALASIALVGVAAHAHATPGAPPSPSPGARPGSEAHVAAEAGTSPVVVVDQVLVDAILQMRGLDATGRPIDWLGLNDANQISNDRGIDDGMQRMLAAIAPMYATGMLTQNERNGADANLGAGYEIRANPDWVDIAPASDAPAYFEQFCPPYVPGQHFWNLINYSYRADGAPVVEAIPNGIELQAGNALWAHSNRFRGHLWNGRFAGADGQYALAWWIDGIRAATEAIGTGSADDALVVDALDLEADELRDADLRFGIATEDGFAGPFFGLYLRVEALEDFEGKPIKSGFAYSSLDGRDGSSLRDLVRRIVQHQEGMTETAWLSYLAGLVHLQQERGHEPKLVVQIGYGERDRTETGASYPGGFEGSSPEAYRDNLESVVAALDEDWSEHLEFPIENLLYLLMPTHAQGPEPDPLLEGYRTQAAELAAEHPRISYVDLSRVTPFARTEPWGDLELDDDRLVLSGPGATRLMGLALSALLTEPLGSAAGFTDLTAPFVGDATGKSRGAAWVDLDGDDVPELVWANHQRNVLVAAWDGATYRDATPPTLIDAFMAGSAGGRTPMQPIPGDYDGDGDPDLAIVQLNHPTRIYRHDGVVDGAPVFTLAAELDLGDNVRNGAWVDLVGPNARRPDGRLDFFAQGLVDHEGTEPEAQWLFVNQGDVEPGAEQFVREPLITDVALGRGFVFADFDDDGDLDLFSGNGNGCPCEDPHWTDCALPAHWAERAIDRVYRNEGGSFVEVPDPDVNDVDDPRNARGVTAGDYDNDGDLDVLVVNLALQSELPECEEGLPFGGGARLLRNEFVETGAFDFTDVTPPDLFDPEAQYRGCAWVDIDNDGDLDAMLAALGDGEDNALWLNGGDGSFSLLTRAEHPVLLAEGNGRAIALADFDRDHDLDVFQTHANPQHPNRLLRNDGAPGNAVTVRLVGTRSNRDGIGARIEVRSASGMRVRDIASSTGYWTQHEMRAHFGLGDDTAIEEIVVHWPSGVRSIVHDVAASTFVAVVECGSDLDADGAVGVADLLAVLAAWGSTGDADALADIDMDGVVGVGDLIDLLADWGGCPE